MRPSNAALPLTGIDGAVDEQMSGIASEIPLQKVTQQVLWSVTGGNEV